MSNRFDLVDFHAHILPAADHGSSSLSTTSVQLDMAVKHGVSRIIATPHFYPTHHTVDSFVERRDLTYKSIPEATSYDIRLGAEVLICNGIESLPGLEKLCVNGTRVLMLELPFADFQSEYCDSVYNLTRSGYDVIMAHADRYDPQNIERLIECGARLQLNADSLCGLFRQKRLYDWLDRDLVVALGSDIHGENKKAYKQFETACHKIEDYIDTVKGESDRIFNSAIK